MKGNAMPDSFIIPVEQYSVQAEITQRNGRLLVNTDHYKAICSREDNRIVGVRKSYFENNTHNSTGVLTNKEGLTVLEKLYKELFGCKGTIVARHSADNWGLALIGNHEMDMNAWLELQMNKGYVPKTKRIYKEHEDQDYEYEGFSHTFVHQLQMTMKDRRFLERLPFTNDFDKDQSTVLSDYTILLAMLNGYDYDDEMKFFVLVQQKERDSERDSNLRFRQNYEAMDNVERKRKDNNNFTDRLYLTLDSFSVSLSHYGKEFSNPIDRNGDILDEVIFNDAKLVSSFRHSLLQFARVMAAFSEEKTNREKLIALSLDIHNINRDASRIKNDTRHADDLTGRIKIANDYYCNISNHALSHLISYIFHSTFIDIRDIKDFREKVRAILTKKQAYRSIVNWLHPFMRDNYKRYRDHVQAQVEVYRRTCELLGLSPE